jgi:hypothetical protein
VRVGVRRGSIGGQRAIGRGPAHSRGARTPRWWPLFDRVTRRMRRRQRRGPHGRAPACASST